METKFFIKKNGLDLRKNTSTTVDGRKFASKIAHLKIHSRRLPLKETFLRNPRTPDLNVDFVFGDCSTCRLLSVVDRAFSTSTLKSGGRGSPSRQDFYTKQKMEFHILLANFLPSTVPTRGCWVRGTTTIARSVWGQP
jgi:hypothetical protein